MISLLNNLICLFPILFPILFPLREVITLISRPLCVLAMGAHSRDLELAGDGVSELVLPRRREVLPRVLVPEVHHVPSLPEALPGGRLDDPLVASIADALLAKAADLLAAAQGRLDVVAVEVAACRLVHEADDGAALDGGALLARADGELCDLPEAVGVVELGEPRHALLPAAAPVGDLVGVEPVLGLEVLELDHAPARDVLALLLVVEHGVVVVDLDLVRPHNGEDQHKHYNRLLHLTIISSLTFKNKRSKRSKRSRFKFLFLFLFVFDDLLSFFF